MTKIGARNSSVLRASKTVCATGFVGGKVTAYCTLHANGKTLVSVLDDLRLVKEYIDNEVILIP